MYKIRGCCPYPQYKILARLADVKHAVWNSCVNGYWLIMKVLYSEHEMAATACGANKPCGNTSAPKSLYDCSYIWKPAKLRSMETQFGSILRGMRKVSETADMVSSTIDSIHEMLIRIRTILKVQVNESVTEALLARLESLLILILDLQHRTTLADCILPTMQYMKTWSPNQSFYLRFCDLLAKILTERDPDADDDQEMETQAGWLESNWKTITKGRFGKRLASAINLLILAGFCPEKTTNAFTSEIYSVLNVQAMRKESKSVLDHIFSTLDWVVEGVIPAFEKGDMSLLLFDSDLQEIDEMYRKALDMVGKNATGQHEANKKLYGVQDEAELIAYLIKTAAACLAVKQKCKDDSHLQREMQNRLTMLDKLSNDIQAGWHAKGSRVQPAAVLIRGPSSVGKSTLSNIIAHTVCRVMGFPEGEEFTVTLNGSDKFQSEYKSSHVVVKFDDIGNTKPEKEEGNPLFVLIQFINNMHCSALSPEVEKKGKNDIRCKLVIVTTNTSDLHSSYFSINPSSIMRRFNFVLDVTLKPDCTGEAGGIHPRFAGVTHPDVWDLKIYTVRLMRNEHNTLADKYALNLEKQTDIIGLIEYIKDTVPLHYHVQDRVVEASASMHLKPHCDKHPLFCLPCPACIKEFGGLLEPERFEDCVGTQHLMQCNELEVQSGKRCPAHPLFSQPCSICAADDFATKFLNDMEVKFKRTDAEIGRDEELEPATSSWKERISKIIALPVPKLKDLRRDLNDIEKSPWMIALGVIASVGMVAYSVHRAFAKTEMHAEGAVLSRIEAASRKPENFVERDNKYQRVYSNHIIPPGASVSTSLQQLERKIDNNLNVIRVQEYDEETRAGFGPQTWANSFPVGKGYWVMAGHDFEKDKVYQVTFQSNPYLGVKRFTELLFEVEEFPEEGVSCFKRLPGTDLIMARCPRGGDTCDFTKYMLPDWKTFELKKGLPLFVYHVHLSMLNPENEYKPPSSYMMPSRFEKIERVRVKSAGELYGDFDLISFEGDNHQGMCGSMVFLGGENPILIGVHTAGDSVSKRCGATPICKEMFEITPSSHMKIAETTEFRKSMYNKPINISSDVHFKSPVHYIEDATHNFEVIGQHDIPTSKFRSEIIESPLMPLMKEKMGYVPTHTSPQKKSVRPSRRRHLLETTRELPPANPRYLRVAIQDLKQKLSKLVHMKKYREFVHPISFKDACSGVPGVKGYDPLNPTTSMGWLLNCPKWKCFVESELAKELGLLTMRFVKKTEVDGKVVYEYEVIFDAEKADVEGETEDNFQWYLEGKRVNASFRCNLKDEAVTFKKVEADKLRVFAGAPVSLVVCCRMLTLPLVNLMTSFPEEFESAVGVDATGRDWAEIRKILTKFGENRNGDGDFGNYDFWIRPEFTLGASEVLKWLLGKADFDDDLLRIFDGMMTDIVYPVYETDGLLFKSFGSGPSGHPLTVVVNGLVNILYMRYAYYAMHKVTELDTIPLFHEVISLIVYGDDNAYCISEEEKLFSMISVGEELSKLGLSYTDASKQISLIPYKHIDEVSFLKRSFHFHETLQEYVGALEKDSIFKSLSMTHKLRKGQRESIAEICAGNLNGALCELYYHSREDYLYYLPIFQEIAAEAVDAHGHRVRDYFAPVTEETIIERFKSTTTGYPAAKEKMYEMDTQSGEVPRWYIYDDVANRARHLAREIINDSDSDSDSLEDPFPPAFNIVESNAQQESNPMLEAYLEWWDMVYGHLDVEAGSQDCASEPEFVAGEWYVPVNNFHDVWFRTFLRHRDIFEPWARADYRTDFNLSTDILVSALCVRQRYQKRTVLARQIAYLSERCGMMRIQSVPFERAEGIFKRQLLRKARPIIASLPSDIQTLILSSFDGPIVQVGQHFYGHANIPIDMVFENLFPWLGGPIIDLSDEVEDREIGPFVNKRVDLLSYITLGLEAEIVADLDAIQEDDEGELPDPD